MVKSRSLKCEKKNKFIINRKRAKSQIKLGVENNLSHEKKSEGYHREKKTSDVSKPIEDDSGEKIGKQEEIAVHLFTKK